jgi:periplasmic protein TonB
MRLPEVKMAQLKNYKFDLRKHYKLFLEVSLITSLSILILAFKFFPDISYERDLVEAPQELFTVEDIQQTKHEYLPPPPPKPAIVIASPMDDILEDIDIASTELDLTEEIAPPPPPRKEDKKIVEEEPQYFVVVEEMPEPIGGIAAIQSKIVYPDIARRAGVEGTVYILAYLTEEGNVVKTEVAKGIGGGCDEAAASAVLTTKFKPGKQRGKPVRVKVMIPVKFQLEDKKGLSLLK